MINNITDFNLEQEFSKEVNGKEIMIKVIRFFKNNLGALPTEIFGNLKLDIIMRKECHTPLLIAKIDSDYYLIDGFHRLQICQESNIDFKVVIIDCLTIEEAKVYVRIIQTNRRNKSVDFVKACFETLDLKPLLYEMGKKKMSLAGKNKGYYSIYNLEISVKTDGNPDDTDKNAHDSLSLLGMAVGISRASVYMFHYIYDRGTEDQISAFKKEGVSLTGLFNNIKKLEKEILENGDDNEKGLLKQNNIRICDLYYKMKERLKLLEEMKKDTQVPISQVHDSKIVNFPGKNCNDSKNDLDSAKSNDKRIADNKRVTDLANDDDKSYINNEDIDEEKVALDNLCNLFITTLQKYDERLCVAANNKDFDEIIKIIFKDFKPKKIFRDWTKQAPETLKVKFNIQNLTHPDFDEAA